MRLKQKKVNRCDQRRKNEAGFTILETAIALVLLAIVGLGAASLFFYATRNTGTENDRELAMAVAQQRLEQLRNVEFSDATLIAGDATTTVTRAGLQYTVRTTIVDSNTVNGVATTKTITIRVRPSNNGTANSPNTVNSVFGGVILVSQRTAMTVGPNRTI